MRFVAAMSTWTLAGLLASAAGGCSDVVVKVNKKNKGSESNTQSSSPDTSIEKTNEVSFEDVENYLKDVDKLKKDGAKYILEQLRDGWRGKFRGALRDLRENIVRNSLTEHSYKDKLVQVAGSLTCEKIEKHDLSFLKGYEGLGVMIQGSLVAKLNKDHAGKLDKALPDHMDDITRMFLFELGVNAKGDSKVTTDGSKTVMESNIIWKVNHETGDDPSLIEADQMSVQLIFTRVFENDKPLSFKLEVRVAQGLFEGTVVGETYYLKIDSQYDQDASGTKSLTIITENGIIGVLKAYSRELVFTRNGENIELYSLKDTARKGLPGEEVRYVELNFKELKKCLHHGENPGTPSSTPTPGSTPDPTATVTPSPEPTATGTATPGPTPTSTSTPPGKGDGDYPGPDKGGNPGPSKGGTPSPTPAPTHTPDPNQNPGQN